MATDRFPIVGALHERFPGDDKDQQFKNTVIDVYDNPDYPFVLKRSGLVEDDTTAAAEGRGLFEWKGDIYAVVGNAVYKNGSALATTLDTSSGRVYFDQAADGTGLLLINDKSFIYTVDTGGTLTKQTDGDIPTTMVAGIVDLDQFAFVMDNLGRIHNSNVGDVTTWSNDFITAELVSDDGVALARYVNYLIAFGAKSIEVFYDAGNATGSPLNRYAGPQQLIGCPAGDTVVNIDGNSLMYVGEDQGGLRSVRMMTGGNFKGTRVSNQTIEEALNKEGADITSAYGFATSDQGHSLYIIVLPTTVQKAYAYDLSTDLWAEWTFDDGVAETWFEMIDSADNDGKRLLLHKDTGQIFKLDPETFQDDGQDINVEIVTAKYDGPVGRGDLDPGKRSKVMNRLQTVGDLTTSTANLNVQWSDNDYQTFTTARTIDLSDHNFLTRLGLFKRRAFKLTFAANQPLRLQALEVDVDVGDYGL